MAEDKKRKLYQTKYVKLNVTKKNREAVKFIADNTRVWFKVEKDKQLIHDGNTEPHIGSEELFKYVDDNCVIYISEDNLKNYQPIIDALSDGKKLSKHFNNIDYFDTIFLDGELFYIHFNYKDGKWVTYKFGKYSSSDAYVNRQGQIEVMDYNLYRNSNSLLYEVEVETENTENKVENK